MVRLARRHNKGRASAKRVDKKAAAKKNAQAMRSGKREGQQWLLFARNIGNSLLVVIPKLLAEKLEIEHGTKLKVRAGERNTILVEKA